MRRFRKVTVIMGGKSREREVSIRSGKRVGEALKKRGYEVVFLDMDENLPWRLKETETEVVFIALHGKPGEDGTVQGLLEVMGIPYTGSGVLASSLAMNKIYSKKIWERENIPTPPYEEVGERDGKEEVERKAERLGLPVVVKPVSEGSSIGVEIVRERRKVWEIVRKEREEFGKVFLEKYIAGKEVTVGILGEGENLRALPVLELVPRKEFYDYQAKYTPGLTEFVIPARLPPLLYQRTQEVALKAHISLGCHSFSRVDILVAKDIPYVHDLNTIPGLTALSDLPAQAEAAGISYEELIEEILSYASTGKW